MSKKYQVFISSTFKDLVEERKKVQEILLMADCIPAGMESFVATDESQFEVIKKIIDLCDYYVLILAGKYGTVNPATGFSYTEMEYDYAISKGIPVLVFCIDSIDKLPSEKKEECSLNAGKLEVFKEKAMKNRLASIWTDGNDLGLKVLGSTMKAKTEISRPGWTRGSSLDEVKSLSQLNDLREENSKLKEENQKLIDKYKKTEVDENIFFEEETLHFTEICHYITYDTVIKEKDIKITRDKIYKEIAIGFNGLITQDDFVSLFSCLSPDYSVDTQQALRLMVIYSGLGLLEKTRDKKGNDLIGLTEKGKHIMLELTVKKEIQ